MCSYSTVDEWQLTKSREIPKSWNVFLKVLEDADLAFAAKLLRLALKCPLEGYY